MKKLILVLTLTLTFASCSKNEVETKPTELRVKVTKENQSIFNSGNYYFKEIGRTKDFIEIEVFSGQLRSDGATFQHVVELCHNGIHGNGYAVIEYNSHLDQHYYIYYDDAGYRRYQPIFYSVAQSYMNAWGCLN